MTTSTVAETANAYIVSLTDVSARDVSVVGNKATNLGELMRAGMLVPKGCVLTTYAFRHFLKMNHISADASFETVTNARIPDVIATTLFDATVRLGDLPLAVRSSSSAEDLTDASFAGQYETLLNVRGGEELFKAVLCCWSSAFNDRVRSYQRMQDTTVVPDMALLIQVMIPADASGVAFSVNPVSGDRDEAVVSAVRGLGERLVSGQVSPDEWFVKGRVATCLSSPEDAITAEQAQQIAAMARKAEAHFGTPQDIEWAISRDRAYLLQSRPITTLRRPLCQK